MRFDELSLHKRLLQAVDHLGFTNMTEIQQAAIPQILAGHDLAASSRTGSGKTLAFLLPLVHRLLTSRSLNPRGPRALILTPTRELAKQVYAQLRLLIAGSQLKGALLLGGENFNDQGKLLARCPQILVGTPGRVANHLQERYLQLSGLEVLALDEADRMLDLGFAEELKQINSAADHRLRQTLMFSATLAHARFDLLAAYLLKSPKRLAIGEESVPHQDISQRFYLCDHLDHKQALLTHLLTHEEYQQAMIFTATRVDTERLAREYQARGFTAVALSGDLKQTERNAIMDAFSRGHYRLLFTTDVASRGLDLEHVSLVINFDMPKAAEEFIHRVGRTGRAGAKGTAISLISHKDWSSFLAVQALQRQPVSFSEIEGLTGKFRGLKAEARPTPTAPARLAARGEAHKGKGSRPLPAGHPPKASSGKPGRALRTPEADQDRGGFAPPRKRKPE